MVKRQRQARSLLASQSIQSVSSRVIWRYYCKNKWRLITGNPQHHLYTPALPSKKCMHKIIINNNKQHAYSSLSTSYLTEGTRQRRRQLEIGKGGKHRQESLGINLCFNSCLFSFWSELSSHLPRGQNEQTNVRSPLPPTALLPVPCRWLSQDTEVSMVFPPKSEPSSALPIKFMFCCVEARKPNRTVPGIYAWARVETWRVVSLSRRQWDNTVHCVN